MKTLRRALGGVGLLYVGLGAMVYRHVVKPRTWSHKESFDMDTTSGGYTEEMVENLNQKVVHIPSSMGYDLYGYWIPQEGAKKTVILVHGITSNIFGALKYYELYRDMGYNVLAYDHRNHGKSGGTVTTLGYHEKKDLETCIEWVKNKVGEDTIVGTHGESMGGGTVIQHVAAYDSVDFVVADCPFADLQRELREVSHREHPIPTWLGIPAASLISRLRGNGSFRQISPLKVIGDVETPMCIIHGDSDNYIYPDHAQDLYDAKNKGIRRLYFAKGADHAESIIKDRENYTREVTAFLEEIGIE